MTPKLLKLHISQLAKTIERSKTNKYSDTRKQNYHNTLSQLFECLSNENVDSLHYNKQIEIKSIIDFAFYSFEFLDNSILTVIPHEIVYCLEKVLKDWKCLENNIVVTTLSNDIHGYYFNPTLSLFQPYHDIIKANYGVEFKDRLIQISLPKYLVHDYLANVVLYHEIGHYVDEKYKISEAIVQTKLLAGEIKMTEKEVYLSHYMEYFADLFSAQYIGDSSNYYLNYIAHKNSDSYTHPATDKRISVVEEFLSGVYKDKFLIDLVTATEKITGDKLQIRYSIPQKNDFEEFVPTVLNSEKELHSVFKIAWDLWVNDVKQFSDKGIDFQEKYRIINNLVEKSISNYMVLEQWNK